MTLRVWNYMALLSTQRGKFGDAQAAAEAVRATSAVRRDPLYASLGHARYALALSRQNDARGALRALGRAEDALGKAAVDLPRPAWVNFYDPAELHGLSAIVHLRLNQPDRAEYHVHQTLARIKPEYGRNRAYYTAQLALAQVKQGGLEQACATADTLYTDGLPDSGRVRDLLREFRTEAAATGSTLARTWLTDTRSNTL